MELGADTSELRICCVLRISFFSFEVVVLVGVMAYSCSVVVTEGCKPASLSFLMMVAIAS